MRSGWYADAGTKAVIFSRLPRYFSRTQGLITDHRPEQSQATRLHRVLRSIIRYQKRNGNSWITLLGSPMSTFRITPCWENHLATEGTIIYLRSCHQASQIQFIDVVERLNCATQSAGFRPGSTDLGRQGCSRWQTCDSNR